MGKVCETQSVIMEDGGKQKAGKAPINFSIMKTWVLSLYRLHGFDSIKGAIEQFAHDLTALLSLLT